jgi:hypothetical protein
VQAGDLLRERVDLGSQLVALGHEVALAPVQFGRDVEVGEHRRVASPRERGAHDVGFGAETAHVEHPRTVVGPPGRPDPPFPPREPVRRARAPLVTSRFRPDEWIGRAGKTDRGGR